MRSPATPAPPSSGGREGKLPAMITVAGEALVDLLVDGAGAVSVHPGGASLNVARTIAGLGVGCRLLGRVSEDPFGALLLATLEREGVLMAVPAPVQAPSTLAVGTLGAGGDADYRFYLAGTSAGQLSERDIPPGLADDTDALVLGGLGLLMEPLSSTLLSLLSRLPSSALVVLDPNCRRRAIGDVQAHRALIERVCERADVVKVSTEDLAQLAPGAGVEAAAREVLGLGPKAVLVTGGPAPVAVHSAGGISSVPVPEVRVADTVGSGDAFVGAFTAWWRDRGLGRADLDTPELLRQAVEQAVLVAALTCTVAGAQPPRIPGWLG